MDLNSNMRTCETRLLLGSKNRDIKGVCDYCLQFTDE